MLFSFEGNIAMTMLRLCAAVLVTGLLTSVPAEARVTVRFVAPERYTDADYSDTGSYHSTTAYFRNYIEDLGRSLLAPGHDLAIDVLNIDLAGRQEFWRGGSQIRVLRDYTAPSFRLRYVLKQRGQPTRSAEETVTDVNYQASAPGRFSSERFVYEKALLRDWFSRRFGRP